MKLSDKPLSSPAENLACEEALLDLCEAGQTNGILRFWEPTSYFVVVGYANSVAREVNVSYCTQAGIPIFRRCSGGGTVLQGPGCLNYSLILRIEGYPALQSITSTNAYILERHSAALTRLLGRPVRSQGHTDLAIDDLKISGNAQRRKKSAVLFHGSFLLGMDLNLISKTLPMPSKQPDYRANRSHREFLLNLDIAADALKTALTTLWEAKEEIALPVSAISKLVQEKYGVAAWNHKF